MPKNLKEMERTGDVQADDYIRRGTDDMNEKELSTEEWRAEKRRKKAEMAQRQSLPYDAKVKRATMLAHEFQDEMDMLTVHAWCDLEPYKGGEQ